MDTVKATQWFETVGVFDLETTGIDVETSRIVTAHVGVIDVDGEIVEATEWLVHPGVEIPPQASAVHGITTQHAHTFGRLPVEAIPEILAALQAIFDRGFPVAAYNAPYDLTLLNREAVRHGFSPLKNPTPVIDPLVIDRAVDRYRKGKRTLEAAAATYGVLLSDAHNAGADAVAAGRIAQALAKAYPTELSIDVFELHNLQIGWCEEQAASFQEYMRSRHNPAFIAVGAWPEVLSG